MVPWLGIAFMLVVVGCADAAARSDSDAGGRGSGGSAGAGGDAWSGGGGGGEAGPGGAPAPIASWSVQSNIVINGYPLDDAIASAAAVYDEYDGVAYTQVVLTNVPEYCAALESGNCRTGEPNFKLELQLVGTTEPGTYEIAEGTASAFMGDVIESCIGGGVGATGTVTFSTIDLEPGGVVELTFDLDFLTGYAEGSVVAPLCDYDATP